MRDSFDDNIFKASFKQIKNEANTRWWNEKMWLKLYKESKNQENQKVYNETKINEKEFI